MLKNPLDQRPLRKKGIITLIPSPTPWVFTRSLATLLSRSLNRHSLPFTSSSSVLLLPKPMDKRRRKQPKTVDNDSEEVSSIEWEFINMTEQEEDLIYRMYRLVGARWHLIAGRIPGRKAEEIERFWIMRHGEGFAGRRKGSQTQNS